MVAYFDLSMTCLESPEIFCFTCSSLLVYISHVYMDIEIKVSDSILTANSAASVLFMLYFFLLPPLRPLLTPPTPVRIAKRMTMQQVVLCTYVCTYMYKYMPNNLQQTRHSNAK